MVYRAEMLAWTWVAVMASNHAMPALVLAREWEWASVLALP